MCPAFTNSAAVIGGTSESGDSRNSNREYTGAFVCAM